MKVIDLLNKIANNEEIPKKIKFRKLIYYYDGRGYFHNEDEDTSEEAFLEGIRTDMVLNDEVEIIEEEKEIEKFEYRRIDKYKSYQNGMTKDDREHLDSDFKDIFIEINELINEVNKLKRKNNDSNV